ncbi:O-antigen ligase [Gammaproteobacteria bacterium]
MGKVITSILDPVRPASGELLLQKSIIGRWQDVSTLLARVMAIIAIFSLALSPNVVKITLPAAVLFSLLSGNWQKKYQLLKKNSVVILAIILVLLFAIGTLYSKAPWSQIATGFFKYTKILYLLFLLPLFAEQKWRKIATNTLIVSIFLDIVVCFLVSRGIIVDKQFYPGGYAHYAINTSAILGFVEFVLINRAIDIKKYRWFYLFLFCIGFYSLFFPYTERTGQLVFLGLIVLGLWQRFSWRGIVTSFVVLPLLVGGLFLFSPSFHGRVVAGVSDIVTYKKNAITSVGLRLAFAQYSFKAIKAHPIFGNGTGSFMSVYATTGGPCINGSVPCVDLQDPHNEYVILAVQLGGLGLICLLLWLTMQWFDTRKLPLSEKRLAQGIILSFIIIGFCNTALFIGLSGLFYIVFLSVYFAARYDNNLNIT